jgi:hypothetical protein
MFELYLFRWDESRDAVKIGSGVNLGELKEPVGYKASQCEFIQSQAQKKV